MADEQKQQYQSVWSALLFHKSFQHPSASSWKRLEKSESLLQEEEGDRAAVIGDSLTFLKILSHSGQVQRQGNLLQLHKDTKSMALKSMETRDRQTQGISTDSSLRGFP